MAGRSPLTLGDVLRRLQARGLIDEPGTDQVASRLKREKSTPGTPWFIHVLIAIGAWMAAICFLAFLGLAEIVSEEPLSLFICGLFCIAGAVGLHRIWDHVFSVQLSLALSVAGHAMTLAGTWLFAEDFWPVPIVAFGLCAVLYPLHRNPIHRFLSSLSVTATLTAWLLQSELHHGVHAMVLLETAGVCLLLSDLNPFNALRPMGYALAVSLLLTPLLALVPEKDLPMAWWPSRIFLTAGLVWIAQWAAGGLRRIRREPIVLALLAAVVLGIVSTPGILAALALMVLGYAQRDRPVWGLGIVFCAGFIVVYYYDLSVDLATKSWILAGSGAVLLFARWCLRRRPWTREATT